MNWYKKISQRIIDNPRTITYEDIGHSIKDPANYDIETDSIDTTGKENYLWVYLPEEDRIYSVIESDKNPLHHESILKELMNRCSYFGRYDAISGKLSISYALRRYFGDIIAYRDVPEEVLSALYREFPNIKYIYFFGNISK